MTGWLARTRLSLGQQLFGRRSKLQKQRRLWLTFGVVFLSIHPILMTPQNSRANAEENFASPDILPVVNLMANTKQKVESRIWRSLKRIFQLSRDIIRILKRAFYLILCFSPSIATSPVLLLGFPNITQWWWDITRQGIWAAGPCMTKFSQWAATRPDIFSLQLCDHLARLQCNTKPHSWNDTTRILALALGPQWSNFLQLDKKASVGSGLVAQVYRGKLTTSSSENLDVAVKVLHPHVRKALESDLALMTVVVTWLENLAYWGESLFGLDPDGSSGIAPVFSLAENLEEFRQLMMSQLDLEREGKALLRFRHNFSAPKWANQVIFPEPIDVKNKLYLPDDSNRTSCDHDEVNWSDSSSKLCGSSDILIETYQEGIPMTDILGRMEYDDGARSSHNGALKHEGNMLTPLTSNEEKQIAALGMDILLKMIFEDNFVHGDLHPGNILLMRPVGKSGGEKSFQLVLLDAGIYTELNRSDREKFLSLFKAVIDDDGERVARMMIEKSREFELPNGKKTRLKPLNQDLFESKMKILVHRAWGCGLRVGGGDDIGGVSGLLQEVLRLCYEHRVRLDSRFVSVVLGVAVIEGLGRRLDPSIDLLTRAAPFIAKAAAKEALSL